MDSSPLTLPSVVPVVQHFPNRALSNIAAEVQKELKEKNIGAGLPRGARIALTAGSRGIANLAEIVRSAAAYFREAGLRPFVIPAMGSHGGGTAEGQTGVLARYGVTEAAVGCPVISSVETVPLGATPEGIETFLDRTAFESDGIFLINRVKWHTSFEAPIESGLLKMAAIGLGKVAGAKNYHQHAVRLGLGAVVRSVGRHVVNTGKILGGLGIVEDARHQTGKVEAVRPNRLEEVEQELLKLARSWMACIPFEDVDILILDEIGKTISGTGMDSKIVNRHPYGGVNPWPWAPRIARIYVRDLNASSYGNAVGIGMAELISERLYQKIDWNVTLVNALTASNPWAVRTPIRAASDKEALQILTSIVGRNDRRSATMVWIRNTLELDRMVVTENLLETEPRKGEIEAVGSPRELEFDADGNLAPLQWTETEYLTSTH